VRPYPAGVLFGEPEPVGQETVPETVMHACVGRHGGPVAPEEHCSPDPLLGFVGDVGGGVMVTIEVTTVVTVDVRP
jgi:hypothetical protein